VSSRRRTTSSGTPATGALGAAGVDFTVHEFEHERDAASFGLEAAAALGVDAGRVFKTLVIQTDRAADKGLAVAVIPVDKQLDLKAVSRELGCKRSVLADPAVAERTTGYLVGGISPVGQKRQLATLIDGTATDHATILVSAGRRGVEVELTAEDMMRVTGARAADLTR
jgi:Cys-tRNA(Pro)/Cys-tRNA(Cys) deacylase